MSLACLTLMVVAPAGASGPGVHTIDPADTVATSVELSRLTFPPGGSTTAMLARADLFADALASGGLAAGPLLLTPTDRLHASVAGELERLGTTEVTVLGGPGAVSDDVLDELRRRGITPTRVSGPDRVVTAVEVAERVVATRGFAGTALLARAFPSGGDETRAFADSVAASAWSAETGWPVLLSASDALSAPTAEHLQRLGYERVVLLGGTGALSDQVEAQVRAIVPTVERVRGSDRAATAVAVADRRLGDQQVADVVVVDATLGTGWAGGIAGAAFSASRRAPVLLADAQGLSPVTREWLDRHLSLDGGTSTLVCVARPAACDELERIWQAGPDSSESGSSGAESGSIRCEVAFVHAGRDGCQTTVAGLDAKYFPVDGGPPQRLAVFFHGDSGRSWFENYGFSSTVLDFADDRGIMVLGFLATTSYEGRSDPAYGAGTPELALNVAQAIDLFLSEFGVVDDQSLYWSVSGGSWFLSYTYIATVGHRHQGIFALNCGGSASSTRWEWDPEARPDLRSRFAILHNYGDQDFLAEEAAGSHGRFGSRGFDSSQLIHEGAEHCRHPMDQPTVDHFVAHIG